MTFFRYKDSDITQPCSEVVVRTVLKDVRRHIKHTDTAVQAEGGLGLHSPARQFPTPAAAQRAAGGALMADW